MVAVQVLLMNYFLLGLHTDQQISNDVFLPDEPLLSGGDCSYGCLQCSPINGCLACKPPYFLYLHRDGSRQTALCTRSCPVGFYKLKRKNKQGFCAKCMLRGCRECSTRHFCSVCKRGLVRHAGRCRKRCPEDTVPSARYPGLCLSAPETVPGKSSNEIELNGTISNWKPTLGFPGTRKPHPHPPPGSSVPLYPSHEGKGVTRRIPSHPTTSQSPPVLQPPEDPSMTRVEDTFALYPELTTSINNGSTSLTTPRPRRRHKKKRRKKKRRKEKDKRRHERNRKRKARERRRRRRLRNKERRKKIGVEDVPSTVAPVTPVFSIDN
ncbi:R-spondin-1-like [Palaemon carinicauda]|uniref:R-spondin-1-like n=1 Tax=Palaemon carinicauda TaxID=392227 RepID=UPI0035B620DB